MKKSIIALAISGLMSTTIFIPTADAQEVTQIRLPSRNSISDRINSFNPKSTEEPKSDEENNSSPTTTKIKVPTRFSPSKLFWFSSPVDKDKSTTPTTPKENDNPEITENPITTTPPTTTENNHNDSSTETTPEYTAEPEPSEDIPTTTDPEIPDVEPLDQAVIDTREAFNKANQDYQAELRNKENLKSSISSLENDIELTHQNLESLKKENKELESSVSTLTNEKDNLIKQRDSLGSTKGYTIEQKQAIVAQAIEEMINDYRLKNGFHKLAVHPDLKDHAQKWSKSMADNSSFGQTEGFTHSPESLQGLYSGENIVAFNTNNWKSGNALTESDLKDIAIQAFNAWKNSPGHNDTMLDPTIQIVGAGLVFDKGAVYATTTFNNEMFIMDGYSAPRGKGGDSFPQQESTMYKSYLPQGAKDMIGLRNWTAPKDYKYRYIYTSDDVLVGGGPEKRIDRFANPAVGSDPKMKNTNKDKVDDLNKRISEKQSEINSKNEKIKDNSSEISQKESSIDNLNSKLEEKNKEYGQVDENIAELLKIRNESYDEYNKAVKERSDFKKKYGI